MPFTDLDYTGAAGADLVQRGNLVDRSGTIATGATAQQLAAANPARIYLLVENISAGDLWVNFGVTAVQAQPSVRLIPGASAEYSPAGTGWVPATTISIIGATTAQAFVAKEA